MTIGVVGRKSGMTRIFDESGASIPVTVVEVLPIRVTQLKSVEKEGHNGVQLTYGKKPTRKLNKPTIGHLTSAGVEGGEGFIEFKVDSLDGFEVGAEFNATQFDDGQTVDVTGVSKGKGFAGCVKRHNFAMQDATHGNSLSHRAPGSIGQNQTPGRVFKGKKMSGQMGAKQVTVQNLSVVKVDKGRNLLLIKGSVPGSINGRLVVRAAVKETGGM